MIATIIAATIAQVAKPAIFVNVAIKRYSCMNDFGECGSSSAITDITGHRRSRQLARASLISILTLTLRFQICYPFVINAGAMTTANYTIYITTTAVADISKES